MSGTFRRDLFSAAVVNGSTVARGSQPAEARSYSSEIPWMLDEATIPAPIKPGPFQYLTQDEVAFPDVAVSRLMATDVLNQLQANIA